MNQQRYQQALADLDASLLQFPFSPKTYLREIRCIQQLNLPERLSAIPTYYVNALFCGRYSDPTLRTTKGDYIQFLKQHNAYKSNVQHISNDQELSRVLRINPGTLIVLDIFASWCGPCKVRILNLFDIRRWLRCSTK